jgi:hypothetical protein
VEERPDAQYRRHVNEEVAAAARRFKFSGPQVTAHSLHVIADELGKPVLIHRRLRLTP